MKTAAFAATRNLYPDLAPPVKALLKHSSVERIYIVAEDDEIGYRLPAECEVVNISGQKWFPENGPNYKNGWSWMVLMRAVYHRLFPDLDRVLSLDVDAFVLKNIDSLWSLDLHDKMLAGVRETTKLDRPELPYYNFGVVMLNLEKLRTSGAGDQIVKLLNKRRLTYPEQDAVNLVCSGCFLTLPSEYNAGQGTKPYGDPYIRHFMGEQKTYRGSEIYRYYRDLPWQEVRP